ncbi:reverse transcriptase domain-containing protein [Tanacetum coccineum]
MVWSGYAVLMSGKTDSIKINSNPGCLPGSTFVYNKVFKLDFSSLSFHLMHANVPACEPFFRLRISDVIGNGGILLHCSLVWCLNLRCDRTTWYGYCKNHKKTVKAGQTQTRDGKEHTRAGDLIARRVKSELPRIMVCMIPSFLHSSNHSNDLEMESSFVLSRTLVYGSVQWIRRIRRIQYNILGTDIAKISRKRSKPDKHGHGKGKRIQEPGECYQRPYVNHVPKSLPKPNIPYPSRRDDQKFREKASNQMEKILQIFQDLRFDISFADALLLMPRFAPTIKSLLMNKEKLLELAKIPLNENFSAMLLKKLPEKLGDPGKFLIPCNFPGMDVCHALADLGASINLMPLSFWKKLSLPDLTPTRMTLELADRSITHPKGLAEDVYVKVGKFHFPTDFVVVDFEADPRVPLILGRSFLRTGRALIDVYGEEITLRVDNEAVTFNLDQTTRYSSTNDKSVNRIDIIDAVCEEYAPELLGFSNSSGGNPTPTSEPFTSEFILEEIEAYLKDDSISPEIDHADCDPEGDICLIEKLLNNDPFQLPPMDLKQSEVTKAKSSIEEPPELELKDLPSHLEYAYLEENDKLPVIIAKGLNDDEKNALLKVLKSHKRAIAWKITDIKDLRDQDEKSTFPMPYGTFRVSRYAIWLCVMLSRDCIDAFQTLKKKLTEAPILVVPDWNLPFELMCDASDFAIGAVLGQRKMKHFQPIHYASKTMTEAQIYYTTTEKEILAVVYAFEKFRPYLVLSKSIVYTDHSALKYLVRY